MAYLALTHRALRDIEGIKNYSIEQWGERVADDYLNAIEGALGRLRENPQLLRTSAGVSDSLCFYRVRQHFVVCSLIEDRVVVLTVKHGAMDLPSRIAELEPQLKTEAEMMHRRFKNKRP